MQAGARPGSGSSRNEERGGDNSVPAKVAKGDGLDSAVQAKTRTWEFERRTGKKGPTPHTGAERQYGDLHPGGHPGDCGPVPQAGTSGARHNGKKAARRAATSVGRKRTTLHWNIRGRKRRKNW